MILFFFVLLSISHLLRGLAIKHKDKFDMNVKIETQFIFIPLGYVRKFNLFIF